MMLHLLLFVAAAVAAPPQNAAPPVAAQPASGATQAAPQQPATPASSPSQSGTTQPATQQLVPPSTPTDPCAGIAQVELCTLVEGGELADLLWWHFSDYRRDVKDFYQAGGYSLVWTAQNQLTPQARAIIAALQDADRKGLRAEDYDSFRWDDRLARLAQSAPPPSTSDWTRFDLALTVSAMRYISDLHNGRISPQYFSYGLDVLPKKYNLAEFLRTRVIAAPDIAAVLQEVEPSHPAYRRAMAALAQYVALARTADGEPLPVPEDKVKPGDVYSALPQLAQRLRLLGDLPAEAGMPATTPASTAGTVPVAITTELTPPKDVYDGDLVKAVKHFQQRHGLVADGTMDKDTFIQLNVPLSHRVVQLQLALERWRWLPNELPPPMIMVNIPEFELRAFRDGQTLSMKTVVGKAPDHQTPVFSESMRFLIFRPYWNVPKSIVEKELLPAITRSTAYLDKHFYEIVDKEGEVIPPEKVDVKVLRLLKAKKLEVRQKPGPANSLGAVKFLFPNQYDVYMHGTPERRLFAKSQRDFSHGCVRVEDPAALAAWVLRGNPKWNMQRIRAAMTDDDDPMQVSLPQPIPVFILYGTSWVEENGEIHFFDDVYGHDAQLESALEKGQPFPVQNPTPNPTVFVSPY